MSFPVPGSPTPGPSSGSARRPQQQPLRQFGGQSINQLQSEMADDGRPNYNIAATQQRLIAVDNNRDGVSLNVPAQHHYPTRLLPNPIKRKRYSIDDVTFQLGKVRVNKSGQASITIIPPEEDQGENDVTSDWSRHISPGFTTLPAELQTSLRQTLTSRSISARKSSSRITSSLTPSATPPSRTFDIITAISSTIDILVLVGKHLRPRDILNLYSISRPFHTTLNTQLRSSVILWARHTCPIAAGIFPYQFYVGGTVPDPMGRPKDPAYHDLFSRLSGTPYMGAHLTSSSSGRTEDGKAETRSVPSLVYLQFLYARSTRVRDIIACLARQGHRLPPGSDSTLLKLWLIMDLPTNEDRATVIRTKRYFTDLDMFGAAVLLVKLTMRFNDPLYGPDHGLLLELMLGQRGLTPLWRLLRGKGYTTVAEVGRLKIRYDVRPTTRERKKGLPVMGVPVHEMGRHHLEGWGSGDEHLLRPDELVVREGARRGIEAHDYVESMAVYGMVDIARGVDVTPGVEEVYMSDEELPEGLPAEERGRREALVNGGGGNVPFGEGEWTPRLVRRARREELAEEVRRAVEEDERDEMLRALVWEDESKTLSGSSGESEESEEAGSEAGSEGSVVHHFVPDQQRLNYVDANQQPRLFDDDSVLGSDSDDGDSVSIFDEEDDGVHSRACSSNMPDLQSRMTSFNSLPVMTPPPYSDGSPDIVGIHDQMDVDEMDLDNENMDSTLLCSSLTATPLKFPEQDSDEEEEEDSDDDEEEELTEEEQKRLDTEFDDELKAQADQYYSESELEYDWDTWREEAHETIDARGGGDDEAAEERGMGDYERMF